VSDSKLLGANKVVLNQMALGKTVESPDALDLPLELALAVLKDSDGVIDIGLPVSGDLNDPQFDYGAVIAKAIGNVLGGIQCAICARRAGSAQAACQRGGANRRRAGSGSCAAVGCIGIGWCHFTPRGSGARCRRHHSHCHIGCHCASAGASAGFPSAPA